MPSDKNSPSPLVRQQSQFADKETYNMPEDEERQYNLIIPRIIKARNKRESPRDEFDGMSYEQAYLSNKRAAMSYLIPKVNDDEVRVNTGTTEKKIELVMSELMGMNLEEEIETYDKGDNFLEDLSEAFTDVVRRTEQMESARDKDLYIYQELLTQPCVFVEEIWSEEPRKQAKRGLKKRRYCERRMIQGVQMYLGDVNMPDVRFNEQPYLVKYARMSYDEGERLFKDLMGDKWNYVKPGAYPTLGASLYNLYRKGSLTNDEIEAFTYMSYPDDEIQIIVNGVSALPVGEKYTDIYGGFDGYHITMVSLKPLGNDFAYGKPLTQSAKTLQALDNETIRNMIRKARQALEPPVGIPKGKMYTRDIWNPGAIIQGIKKNDFEKLIDHQGVTRSDMAMFDLIEKKMNEFIGSTQGEPLQGKSQVTATEFMLAQKNAVKMLGNSILACMRLKQRLAMLRVKNILSNYTKPVGKEVDPVTKAISDVYARFTVNDVSIGGSSGTRVIQMANQSLNDEQQKTLFNHEQKMKKQGTNIEYKVINVNKLKNFDGYFYANVTAKPRETSQLEQAMIQDKIKQGQVITAITGRKMNANKLIEGFERAWKEKDLFEKVAPPTSMTGPSEQGGGNPADIMGGRPVSQNLKDMRNGNAMNQMPKPEGQVQ